MPSPVADSRPMLIGNCVACPLFVDSLYKQLVRGYGVGDGLCIIGEAPGANEVSQGRPFVGMAGRLIRSVLQQAGVDPDEDVYWTNAVLCRPPGNKTPTPTAIKACNDRLRRFELPMVMPHKILMLGGVALSGAMGVPAGLPITKWRGKGMNIPYGVDDEFMAYGVATYHPAAVLRDLDLFRDFSRDIQKLIETEAPLEDLKMRIIVPGYSGVPASIDNTLDAVELMLREADIVACDLETMGLNPMTDDIISIGFGAQGETEDVSIIVPVNLVTEEAKRRLCSLMQSYQGELVFHNAKFDLQFLDVYFGEPLRPPRLVDTMIMHYVLDERPIGRYFVHGLKDLARAYYDADDYRFDFNTFYAKLPKMTEDEAETVRGELFEYQARDTIYTAKLAYDFQTELVEEYGADVDQAESLLYDILFPGTLAFTEIELYGVSIDVPYLLRKQHEYTELLTRQLEELRALAWPDFNPSSPVQVQRLFFDEWKLDSTYGKSTEREALDQLKKRTRNPAYVEGINRVIEYRLRSKVLATYINGMLQRIDPDGRLRTDIRIAGTATGRLSSSDPNLQNIPTLMGPEIRAAFVATPGYTFIEADYSQLELRVAAWYSRDPGLVQTFKDGKDIHRAVAASMFNKPESAITEHERYLAKYVDFGVIYGRQARSLAEGWEMDYLEEKLGGTRWSVAEAERFLNEFLNSYPRLSSWMKQKQREGLQQKYVASPLGRRRRFPFVNDSLASHIGRQAVNTPIQGFASDICLTSLIRLHKTLPEGAAVLFPVHDAIYLEVRDDILDEVVPLIRRGMETDLPCGVDKVLPFPVKLKVGPRWSEVQEVKS